MPSRIVRPDSAFSLGAGQRKPRQHDDDHLSFIRKLPSLVGEDHSRIEAAHIRYGSLVHGKRETGASEKPNDAWTVPLSAVAHRMGKTSQHASGERAWWTRHLICPLTVAALLYANSGNLEAGREIIQAARRGVLFRQIAEMTGNKDGGIYA